MSAKPMLDDIELQLVQSIEAEEEEALVQHGVPALEGDFLQRLGRRSGRIRLAGVMTGSEAADALKQLRSKFRAAEPVSFVADIATATKAEQMLIEEMGVRELAGRPARFEYALVLREYFPAPETESEDPPEPEPPVPLDPETGQLVVEVVVEDEPEYDFGSIVVEVEGMDEAGSMLMRTLSDPVGNAWTDPAMPPGQFVVRARASDREGIAEARIRPGQTTEVEIVLRPAAASSTATMFLVHFRFDSAFVEPSQFHVLRQAAAYAQVHRSERLLIFGHTDNAGPSNYNQSLSERRARAVRAFLTARRDLQDAVDEWEALRQPRNPPGEVPTIEDRWGTREYQHVLQDLGFYPGRIDGRHGPTTDEAVRAYRCRKGLPTGTQVDDEVWDALIRDCLTQNGLEVPTEQFFPNCAGEFVKWLGAGEEDPVSNTTAPHRPSRRVELLFVRADRLPREVPQPDTFDQPRPGVVGSGWCAGPANPSGDHASFVVKHLSASVPQPADLWRRIPADAGSVQVEGSIKNEDGTPLANAAFLLATPRGEFLVGENARGEGIFAHADARGEFSFASKPAGFYVLELQDSVLARLAGQSGEAVKGGTVCAALRAPGDRLDVVVVNAPCLREIRLPVVAHLMTALEPTTREVRTCPLLVGGRAQQATALTPAQVRAAIDQANRIWQQARVRFTLDDADIVREFYSFRRECQIDHQEFLVLLERCATPDAVNVFFVGDLAGSGEAGFGISPEDAAADGGPLLGGCAVSDRIQGTLVDMELNDVQRAQVLAHELGHFLHLPHADAPGRLMLPSSTDGSNQTLTEEEALSARSSQAGACRMPLQLAVSGAVRIGAAHGNQFILVRDPSVFVVVEAQLPDRLLEPSSGVLAMTGGSPGTGARQRVVSGATAAATEVVATYTPTNGAPPAVARVLVRIANFELKTSGAAASRVGSTVFVASRHETEVVVVSAELTPAPFCVPAGLVQWNGGTPAADPLRVTVPRSVVGLFVVQASMAGVTRSVSVLACEVAIVPVVLVGLNQTVEIQVVVAPSPLPENVSVVLRLRRTTGSGEARFVGSDSALLTISRSGLVVVRGIAASSVAGNIRLEASLGDSAEIVAQADVTVVSATIASVLGVRPNETLDIPVTVLPSPLPPGSSLTLELSTTEGSGSARFADGNSMVQTIGQTTTLAVRGIASSSRTDNIRLAARISGQSTILAQEDFTVLNRIEIFLKFEVWNLDEHAFSPLPAGVVAELLDDDLLGETLLAERRTDGQGRVVFSLPDFGASGEDDPDLFFRVRPNGLLHAGHQLPAQWSTKGWRAADGSPGIFESFVGTRLGSETAPLTYRIGLDLHARVSYRVDGGLRRGQVDPAPLGLNVKLLADGDVKRNFQVDAQGEVHGVLFNAEGGSSVSLRIDFEIEDASINLRRAKVDVDPWETFHGDNQQTSLGTQAVPLSLHADGSDRNVALYFLKVLREVSTFLFHATGGAWTGFEDLKMHLSSISGVAYSWPVGSVNLPPVDHWNRAVIAHEITHQTMWKEHDRSSLDIAFEALFGDMALNHREDLRANPEHALIEGWAELLQALFAQPGTPEAAVPPYRTATTVGNSDGDDPLPLGPPPANRGEIVEGAFANGLWAVFERCVVTAAVFGAAGRSDARIPESANGDVMTAAPWLAKAEVRRHFLEMIWNPFRDLRTASKTTTAMLARMRARNPAAWHLLQAELNAFNLAMTPPLIAAVVPSSGPAAGGQAVVVSGGSFVPGMRVRFVQPPSTDVAASGVTVASSASLTVLAPPGTPGSANVLVETSAGTATLVNGYTYV